MMSRTSSALAVACLFLGTLINAAVSLNSHSCSAAAQVKRRSPRTVAERRRLAATLVAQYESLERDAREQQLWSLGIDAVRAALEYAWRLDLKVHALRERAVLDAPGDPYGRLYSIFSGIRTHMKPEYTGVILDYIARERRQGWKPDSQLLTVLSEGGDDRALPLFLGICRHRDAQWEYFDFLARSRHRDAIRFMISALNDPRAVPNCRNAAFCNLAHTGGEAGLNAVLAARDSSQVLPPLEELMRLGSLPANPPPTPTGRDVLERDGTRLLAVKSDSEGVRWALIRSSVLGSYGDLWIARWNGNHWTHPLFTDVSYKHGFNKRRPAPPKRFYGLSEEEMLAGGWFDKLVHNPEIEQDTDGDGLNDLAEKRLGTDPNKADTDGDGIPDGSDRCPLAAGPPQTEAEEILAAAFEGRFKFMNERLVPCVVSIPDGLHATALAGWNGYIIHEHGDRKPPIGDMYGHGTGYVSFHLIDISSKPNRHLKWKDHEMKDLPRNSKEVIVMVRTYYDGLDGTGYAVGLRKMNGRWVVISSRMLYIS